MVQLPTLLYLFMNFLEIEPCIQHCKFWGLCLEGVSGKKREREGAREREREGDTSVDFIDIKMLSILLFLSSFGLPSVLSSLFVLDSNLSFFLSAVITISYLIITWHINILLMLNKQVSCQLKSFFQNIFLLSLITEVFSCFALE